MNNPTPEMAAEQANLADRPATAQPEEATFASGTNNTTAAPGGATDYAELLYEYFLGFERGKGVFTIKGVEPNGKVSGKAETTRSGATVDDWRQHLAGKQGLGIVPIMSDDNCFFGALDIDDRNIDHVELEKACKDLPVCIARSKSGGAHVYVFFNEPVPAALIRKQLSEWAAMLGYGGCEIFPKQTKRTSENDVGNWLNMPYFGGDITDRYMFYQGQRTDLATAIELIQSCRISKAQFAGITCTAKGTGKTRKEQEGRNSFLTVKGLQLRAAHDNEGLISIALHHINKTSGAAEHPNFVQYGPLPDREVDKIVHSIMKEKYASKNKKREKPTNAQILKEIIDANECWRDQHKNAFLTVNIDGTKRHLEIGSERFAEYMTHEFFTTTTKSPSQSDIKMIVRIARYKAIQLSHNVYHTWIRIGCHEGKIYIDLCRDTYECIEIDAKDWRVTNDPPIRFRSTNGHPLPIPKVGGTIELLYELLNVSNADDQKIVIGFLLSCLNPSIQTPLLNLVGEQGTAKTWAMKLFKTLVDPSSATGGGLPKKEDDLVVVAYGLWLLTADNVSYIDEAMSDAICRIITGGGLSKRTLFTDSSTCSLEVRRPFIITSINPVAERQDLLERTVTINLNPIPKAARRTEAELANRTQEVLPMILGTLYSAVSYALRHCHEVAIKELPRMSDHVVWVEAASGYFGWQAGEYLDAYMHMLEFGFKKVVFNHPLARIIVEWLRMNPNMVLKGTTRELRSKLNQFIDRERLYDVYRDKRWPDSESWFGRELRLIKPGLRIHRVSVQDSSKDGCSLYEICMMRPDER